MEVGQRFFLRQLCSASASQRQHWESRRKHGTTKFGDSQKVSETLYCCLGHCLSIGWQQQSTLYRHAQPNGCSTAGLSAANRSHPPHGVQRSSAGLCRHGRTRRAARRGTGLGGSLACRPTESTCRRGTISPKPITCRWVTAVPTMRITSSVCGGSGCGLTRCSRDESVLRPVLPPFKICQNGVSGQT